MRSGPPRLAWGVVACLMLLAPRPLPAQMGLREVTGLRFEGNQTFSDRVLASSIITRDTECRSFLFYPFCLAGAEFAQDPYLFSEREFRRDHARVRLFYYLRGFREAVVDTVLTRTGDDQIQITFRIQEGEPIRVEDLRFEVDGELPDSSILENLPLREGEPLSLVAVDATRDTLESRLRNHGFAHAEVLRNYDLFSADPYSAEVWFGVYLGPLTRFGPISVRYRDEEGRAPAVEESVVRRLLPFRPGNVYEENLLFSGQRTLYNLDLFRSVNVVADSVAPVDSILPVTVELEQGNVHNVRVGGGFSGAECLNFEARWSSRNFMGGARRLQVTARLGNLITDDLREDWCNPTDSPVGDKYKRPTASMSIDLTQPWFFSPRNSLTSSVLVERQSLPPTFIQEAVGLSLGVTHALSPWARLGVSFRPRYSRLDAAEFFFCSAYLICDSNEIKALSDFNTISPLGFTVSQDTRNQLLNPTRGYSALVDLEYAAAWTASDFRFTRIVSEATWHTRGIGEGVLAARLRGGWVGSQEFKRVRQEEIVHPDKRLFAGGANSVRGFPQNRLGPTVLVVDEPERLGCSETDVANGSCDPRPLAESKDGKRSFRPTPTGGTRLLEGSVELRHPLWGDRWEGATFMDFGQVWDVGTRMPGLELTPGLGIRFFSPIGPIRVDLAYRSKGEEDLYVVTQQIGSQEVVRLDTPVSWDQGRRFWNRIQIHLTIGQAF